MVKFTGNFDHDDIVLARFSQDRAPEISPDSDWRAVAQSVLAQIALLGKAAQEYTTPALRDQVGDLAGAAVDGAADIVLRALGVDIQSDEGGAANEALCDGAYQEAEQYLANYQPSGGINYE